MSSDNWDLEYGFEQKDGLHDTDTMNVCLEISDVMNHKYPSWGKGYASELVMRSPPLFSANVQAPNHHQSTCPPLLNDCMMVWPLHILMYARHGRMIRPLVFRRNGALGKPA